MIKGSKKPIFGKPIAIKVLDLSLINQADEK